MGKVGECEPWGPFSSPLIELQFLCKQEILCIYLDVIMHKGWNLPFGGFQQEPVLSVTVSPKNQHFHGRMGYCFLFQWFGFKMCLVT